MGKGDRKTKKGKIAMGSYGVRRPKSKNKKNKIEVNRPAKASKATEAKPKTAAKTAAKSTTKKSTASKTTTKKTTAKKATTKKTATKKDEKK